MKLFKNIWVDRKVQALVIVASLYFLSALSIDFRTSLYPNHYNTADATYSYLIRIISCSSLCVALILILRHMNDYLKHFERIINHENRWIYYGVRVVIVALFMKGALNMLYPYTSEFTDVYFVVWFVLNGMIVVPIVVVLSRYRG